MVPNSIPNEPILILVSVPVPIFIPVLILYFLNDKNTELL